MSGTTDFLIISGAFGLVCTVVGVYALLRPDRFWRWQQANMRIWQGINAERNDMWGVWLVVQALS